MDTRSTLTESGRAQVSKEGPISKRFEKQVTKIPTSFFLGLAGGVVALSLGLAVSKEKKNWASFVGQWVPTILLLGIYDKMSKQDLEKNESKSLLH